MACCQQLVRVRLIESDIEIETTVENAASLIAEGVVHPVTKPAPKRLCDRIACKGAADRGDDT